MTNLVNIKIIDYGMGNIQSVKNAFELLECNVQVIDNPSEIKNADGIILPGVGAFANAIRNLEEKEFINPLKEAVLEQKIPLLGICLGMQLLADSSEERGHNKGLSFIPGDICKIPQKNEYRLPHVGWNDLSIIKDSHLLKNITDKSCFYFVHSYYVEVEKQENSILKTTYGLEFDSAIQHKNVYGAQFHPEKSHKFGMKLLDNFSKI